MPTKTNVTAERLRKAREAADLNAALAGYANHQHRRNFSPITTREHRTKIRALAMGLDADLFDATTEDIETWLDGRGITPQTRVTYISVFATFMRWCITNGLTNNKGALGLVKPKLPRRLPRPMPDDDILAALENANPRMRCILVLAALEGLRAKEVAMLRVEDVDWYGHKLMVEEGKGGKPRVVPLHEEAGTALRALPLPRAGWVFVKSNGDHLSPRTISMYVSRFMRSVGSGCTLHQLRHWFGTKTYESSRDLRLVQELMGHSSPVTTAGYAAITPGARSTEIVNGLALPH